MTPTDLYFAQGGKGDLYKLPPRKTPPTNDWGDLGGLEVDLSRPLWSAYRVELSFVTALDESGRYSQRVLEEIIEGTRPTAMIPYTHYLREVPRMTYLRHLRAVELSCSYDLLRPSEVWEAMTKAPHREPPRVGPQHVTLSGRDLGDLGMGVLSYYDYALRPSGRKELPLASDSAYRSGREILLTAGATEPPRRPHCASMVEVQCVIPTAGDEELLRSVLGRLSEVLRQPKALRLADGRLAYYSEMTDCRLTRTRFYFTLRLQTL